MNIEKLECDKTDTEVVIQHLNETIDLMETIKSDESNPIVKLKLKTFITELNKEVEWNEVILQELSDSINFELNRGDYD